MPPYLFPSTYHLTSHLYPIPINLSTPPPPTKTVEGSWVHVDCALWTPRVVFNDVINAREIAGVPQALKDKPVGAKCIECHLSSGAGLFCAAPGCNQWFHVRCARLSCSIPLLEQPEWHGYCPAHKYVRRNCFSVQFSVLFYFLFVDMIWMIMVMDMVLSLSLSCCLNINYK
jgi:hypothetical protein